MIKKGRISEEEIKFITLHCDRSSEEIAAKLNRLPETIEKYRKKIAAGEKVSPQLAAEEERYEEALVKLHAKPNWQDVKDQYRDSEIKLVEYHWVKLYQQFREDMTHTEELQIFKLINLEIMMDRNRKESNRGIKDLERVEKMMDEEYAKEKEDQNQQYLIQLEQEARMARTANQSRTTEYNQLQDRHRHLLRELKGARDQRLKDIESSNETFFGLIKALTNDPGFREKVSRDMELYKMGMEKEQDRLTKYHKYMDEGVDIPILSADTIDKEQPTDGDTSTEWQEESEGSEDNDSDTQ